MRDEEILDLLVATQYITEEDRSKAMEASTDDPTQALRSLITDHIITQDIVGQAIAEYLMVPYFDLNTFAPDKEDIIRIPEDVARELRLVFFKEQDDVCEIATDNKTVLKGNAQIIIRKEEKSGILGSKKEVVEQKNLNVELEKLLQKPVVFGYALGRDIDKALGNYKDTLTNRFINIMENLDQVAPEIVEEIIAEAVAEGVSDIHFEPVSDEEVRIRFRIDGMLQEVGRIPYTYYENVLNLIKVQARARTDEHYAPQDGAIRFTKNGKNSDVRVSIIPTVLGEKIVLRVLTNTMSTITLETLGFNEENLQKVKRASKKPFGMILVTGPTGSGKSTTLYALLSSINEPDTNITTVEDPVEYKIDGVNHVQVNRTTGLTFSTGLRSILRQDPDIILVGEIRDDETAQISVNAALTGHLLFSTIHANDAPGTLPRLLNMDVDPFLVASTLELIIAQRLARKICTSCVYAYTTTRTELNHKYGEKFDRFFETETITLYRGKGCSNCNYSGYKGRSGVFQLIEMTEELRELIMKNPTGDEIRRLSRKQGSKSMFEDGIEKVRLGKTTLEEILRISAPPEED